MASDPDALTAELAAIRERTERPVPNATSLPISHRGVQTLMESCADVPRLLAAVEAVSTIAAGWLADAPEVPVIDRDLAASVIQQILTRELLSKDNGHD